MTEVLARLAAATLILGPASLVVVYAMARGRGLIPKRRAGATLLAGLLASVLMAAPQSIILEWLPPSMLEAHLVGALHAFAYGALPQEALKLWVLLALFAPRRLRPQGTNAAVHGLLLGIGFGGVQTLAYIWGSADWRSFDMLQGAMALPVHAFTGLLLGTAAGRAVTSRRRAGILMIGLLNATLWNGLCLAPAFIIRTLEWQDRYRAAMAAADGLVPVGLILLATVAVCVAVAFERAAPPFSGQLTKTEDTALGPFLWRRPGFWGLAGCLLVAWGIGVGAATAINRLVGGAAPAGADGDPITAVVLASAVFSIAFGCGMIRQALLPRPTVEATDVIILESALRAGDGAPTGLGIR